MKPKKIPTALELARKYDAILIATSRPDKRLLQRVATEINKRIGAHRGWFTRQVKRVKESMPILSPERAKPGEHVILECLVTTAMEAVTYYGRRAESLSGGLHLTMEFDAAMRRIRDLVGAYPGLTFGDLQTLAEMN